MPSPSLFREGFLAFKTVPVISILVKTEDLGVDSDGEDGWVGRGWREGQGLRCPLPSRATRLLPVVPVFLL